MSMPILCMVGNNYKTMCHFASSCARVQLRSMDDPIGRPADPV